MNKHIASGFSKDEDVIEDIGGVSQITEITPPEGEAKIRLLIITKSGGPDNVCPRILKELAY